MPVQWVPGRPRGVCIRQRRERRQAVESAVRPDHARPGFSTGCPRRFRARHGSTTMTYTHALNRGPAAVRSPAGRMFAS